MRILKYHKSSKPAYVFDESYILDIRECSIEISDFYKYYEKEKKYEDHCVDPRICTKREIIGIGSNWLSQFGRCDGASLTLDGSNVGHIKYNDGYSVASDGAAWRRIQIVCIRVEISSAGYILRISGSAGSVEDITRSPLKVLTEAERKDFEFNYKFVIPLEHVAEVFNFTDSESLHYQNFLNRRIQAQNASN